MLEIFDNLFTKKKWNITPKKGEQFFFMHIPKTGGTTFRIILYNHCSDDFLYPTLNNLKKNSGKYLDYINVIRLKNTLKSKFLILGHYGINFSNHLNPNVKIITFFRDPVERLISHVKHLYFSDESYEGKPINEIVSKAQGKFMNLQLRMLGWEGVESRELVLANIERLDFIGLSSHFDLSIKMLNRRYNWNLECIKPINVTKQEPKLIFSENLIDLITSKLKVEIEIYNIIKEKFFEQKTVYGII